MIIRTHNHDSKVNLTFPQDNKFKIFKHVIIENGVGLMGIRPTFRSNKLQDRLIRIKICAHKN